MQSNITDSIVSQMCRQFKEYKSMMESTVLTLRQQADINTAAMVARGVDTTESTTTDSTTIPETFTETFPDLIFHKLSGQDRLILYLVLI